MIIHRAKWLLVGTLRRQLVVGMVVVVATLMALFIWDLTARQQSALLAQQSGHASSLAQGTAVSSAVWVASRDFSGLQEIINGLARYPDMQHAIVLDLRGQILAHSDVTKLGLYLSDLPVNPVLVFLGHNAALVDVASPIMLAGKHVGWVRIGLGQASLASRLAEIRRDGLVNLLIAVMLAAALATLAARRLTRRLYAIQSVADAVQAGRHDLRAEIDGGDEAAQLARQFNAMLDALAQNSRALTQANAALRTEMTQRREVEAERDRLVSILETTPDVVSMFDPDGRILYLNRAGRSLLGLDQAVEAAMEKSVSDIFPEWAADRVATQGMPAALRAGHWEDETAIRRKGGSEVPVSLVMLAHRDPQGELLYFSTVMRDITERKEAERQLRKLNEALEERVEQRTGEMRDAMAEAERANAAKSEFLSRMSHELRTPLNAILGFGQLLESDLDHPLAETQIDSLREIMQGGTHLLELVNEVLDLSRIESGRLEVNLEGVALIPLVESCVAQLKPLADQRGIDISLKLVDAACIVEADRTRLRQVLLNLLSNAIKYNRENGHIHVRCVANGERLHISIQDSGNGIPADALPRLFRPFERLESAYQGIEGTGIGLALAKKLVEAMHGEIGVESVPGEGSTFWFELPIRMAESSIAR